MSMLDDLSFWIARGELATLPSPSLVIDLPRVHKNIATMIRLAGSPDRLWPHIKTAKMPAVAKLYIENVIRRFKCATLAEAEMLAQAGATTVVVAYPLVGPNPLRLVQLACMNPETEFVAVVETASGAAALDDALGQVGASFTLGVLIDLDVGMHRTGIPAEEADALAEAIRQRSRLRLLGVHVYDGHLGSPAELDEQVAAAFEPVQRLLDRWELAGFEPPIVLCGGSLTMTAHAEFPRRQLSPGTTVFWDAGYSHRFPDLPFQVAAVLLTRVVSVHDRRVTFDLGTKAVASEMPQPRAEFPVLADAKLIMHSEEHLVVETPSATNLRPGMGLLAIPWHICPTVALHREAIVVENHRVVDRWAIPASARTLSFESPTFALR